ncbi:60S ribosomal protein L22 [Coemansia sp. RSA 1822]|nr:60S ribosomal protein L22 [Coemansia sp. RSA 1591]KAJ1776713.1 60S ribosomal protein L22 [Coemansia sp. RSA 1824]KAJ1855941.1 60S ribosomal protein L22 [Coemansia sp. RSA 638]KAJ2124988.1 60S ribosomal protein L22 [Coemansia sp. RSA 720]KAJ2133254.1 60S ribosomal protein L22 [Coemansia sp. RSA 921]KAJ2134548.1 60S ribosomal protein L22 [Coemansia sp. RSA 788]KAJ2145420.1 60S ribosomal protein L22 [Coemansia sp. RSA 564]KAJ2146878.1 60S ribosomal protein L22 [Coemansia sp. RSA 678]KAJ2147
MAPQKSVKAKRPNNRYVIDVSAPANDKIFDVAAFEKFLHDRIKVEGRTNNLGERVNITRTDDKIVVEAKIDFSKRYLKYLTKKFLKKNQLRDWLRVVSESKDTYKLKYFNVSNEAEESGDDEEEE